MENLPFPKFYLSVSLHGNGYCNHGNNSQCIGLCRHLPREEPSLPPSLPPPTQGVSGRQGGTCSGPPSILCCSALSSLLVSPAVKPLGGSVSSQPQSQSFSARVALSWRLKVWREALSLLPCRILSRRPQSSMSGIQCLTELPPSPSEGSASPGLR